MPARSIIALVSTALPIVVFVRVDRASNGVVCAAAPSYDCRPHERDVRQRIDQLRELDCRLARRDAGAAEKQIDCQLDRLALPRAPAASLMSRTFCRSSTTKMVSGALAASATARAILSRADHGGRDRAGRGRRTRRTLPLRSGAPRSSRRRPRAISARATSGHLCVLPCGRNALCRALADARPSSAMLSSKASRSRSRAGVGISPRDCIGTRMLALLL